jgi:Flp pilus assembly protein TadD
MLRPQSASCRTKYLSAAIISCCLPLAQLLLLLSSCLLPVQASEVEDRGDMRALHAALALTGQARELELQRVMPQLQRSGCAQLLHAVALAQPMPPSHTVHMHAAFCSRGEVARAHFLAALALDPSNVESVMAAAYHSSLLPHRQQLILGLLGRLVPPPARTGRQLYALAVASAASGSFRLSSHYFSLAAARGLPLRDIGDTWILALCDGGQPMRALQLLMMAGCCDGLWLQAPGAEAEWCAASAVHVGESLVLHGGARLALPLLQCATHDGRLQADASALSCGARAHRALGDIPAAIALFTQALQLQPDSSDTRRNVGMILQEAGLLQQAEQHLRYCISVNPSDATALSALATVCAKTGRAQEAERLFLAAAALQPGNDSIRSNVVTFYRNSKMWAEAQAFATGAIQRDPAACDMHAQLLQVHAQQSRPLPALRASASYDSCCAAAAAACPDLHSARLSDIFFRRQLCEWGQFEDDVQLLQRAATSEHFRSSSFSAIQASVFPVAPAIIRELARRQAVEVERVRPTLLRAASAAAAARGSGGSAAGDTLRIGFSFSDWFNHPVGDDARAAVAAAARLPSAKVQHVLCLSPSVPLRPRAANDSHPCLQPPVHALFVAHNSTEVTTARLPPNAIFTDTPAGGGSARSHYELARAFGFQR